MSMWGRVSGMLRAVLAVLGVAAEWAVTHWVSVDFVYLTSGTSFDIVHYEVFHAGPPVERLDELDGFGDSGVAGSCGRVKMVKYTPPKIIVFHNNEGRVLP